MARKIDLDAVINRIRMKMQTSHPSSPDSGYDWLYVISGSPHGGLYLKDPSGREIGPFITGSSGGITMDMADPYGLFHRLDSANAADDEFDDGSIAGAWTQVNPTGVVTWVEANHVLSAAFNGQSANDIGVILKAATLGDGESFETCVMTLTKKLTNFTMIGVVVTDGTATTSNACAVIFYQSTTADEMNAEIWTGTLTNMTTSAALHAFSTGEIAGKIRIRLKRNSSTAFVWLASDESGAQFQAFSATTVNPGFTPTHAGLLVSCWGGSQTALASYDYFRKI